MLVKFSILLVALRKLYITKQLSTSSNTNRLLVIASVAKQCTSTKAVIWQYSVITNRIPASTPNPAQRPPNPHQNG